MGRSRRPTPRKLADKLYDIRMTLDLTQEQLIERLGYKLTPLYPGHISEFERGLREPPLLLLLRYARLVGVPMDVLVDDELNLPTRFQRLYPITEEGYKKLRSRLKAADTSKEKAAARKAKNKGK